MKTFLLSVFLLAAPTLRAQTFEEWFRQKKTQREYLVQQVAALQAYAGVLREGYNIARQGMSTVEHIKNGDLGLHQAFFGSLRLVNPVIVGSTRVADILRCQAAIARDIREALPTLRLSGQLGANELAHLEAVQAQVLASTARDLETLWLILTEKELELTDAGRLQRLEELYETTRDNFRFTQTLLRQARALAHWRTREQQDVDNARRLYGLPE